jgi:hypothetical protein
MNDATYDGTPVTIEERESHRNEEMAYVAGNGVARWVFTDELDGVNA